jgi:hypothetical protein
MLVSSNPSTSSCFIVGVIKSALTEVDPADFVSYDVVLNRALFKCLEVVFKLIDKILSIKIHNLIFIFYHKLSILEI